MRRIHWLDFLRGIAVLLMVADHVAALYDLEPLARLVLRSSYSRLSLPIFLLVAGYLIGMKSRGTSRSRWFAIAGTGLAGSLCFWLIGLRLPDPVLALALFLLPWRLYVRYPVWCALFGLVGASAWPWLNPWGSYHPGIYVGCLSLGVLAHRASFGLALELRPWVGWLAWCGRNALQIYLLHLLLLLGLWRLGV